MSSATGIVPCQQCGNYVCSCHYQYPQTITSPTVIQSGTWNVAGLGSPYVQPSSFDYHRAAMEQDIERRLCKRIVDILDGNEFPGPGMGSEPWESTRKKLMALAKIAKAFEMRGDNGK